jgi:CheY-like chemotaxis protein
MIGTQPRVLAIEDVTGTIKEIAGDLEDLEIKVDYAQTVPAAEELLRSHRYDILLVDVMIPGYDGNVAENGGLDVIHRLRSGLFGETNSHTPFFILTGQKPSLDEHALANIPGCLGVEKKLLQHLLLSKIRAKIDETKSRG